MSASRKVRSGTIPPLREHPFGARHGLPPSCCTRSRRRAASARSAASSALRMATLGLELLALLLQMVREGIGWHHRGIWPVRWTRRRTLAEEHHWRALSTSQPASPSGSMPTPRQWCPGPYHPDPGLTPGPEDVAALYRQLRKAFEDGKNEPGAADFYHGECEMRRHGRAGTPKGERRLLWGYRLLSGYGLRASRALGWLSAAMLVTILLLMGFDCPRTPRSRKQPAPYRQVEARSPSR